ncbi:MAG TPA: hypothetical protein VM940_17480 [Chthoniobacterales bacterium]|nr:hypothetical protein [Chthoniobacterales bacterium]
MTNVEGMTTPECRMPFVHVGFGSLVIRVSFVIGHSSFVIPPSFVISPSFVTSLA